MLLLYPINTHAVLIDGERCLRLVLLYINMWEQRNFGDFF